MVTKIGSLGLIIGALSIAAASIGYAQDVKEITYIDDFTEIELNNSSDVRITIGDEYLIRLSGDEDRFDSIEFDKSGDTLEISTKRRFGGFFGRKGSGNVSIDIIVPDLEEVLINGSGDAEVIGLDNDEISLKIHSSGDLYVTGRSDNVEIEIHGSGDVEMDEVTGENVEIEIHGSGNVEFDGGTCDRLTIEVEGSGDVDARDLVCKSAEVEIEGSGNSRVHVTERLVFDGEGSGRLDVFGKPDEVIDNAAKRKCKIRIR